MNGAVELIGAEASRIGAMVTGSRWYLFGSILKDKRPISDIDLLVICETSEDCSTVRFELGAVCSEYPIHLLLMTFDEEREVEFVQGQGAVPLNSIGV